MPEGIIIVLLVAAELANGVVLRAPLRTSDGSKQTERAAWPDAEVDESLREVVDDSIWELLTGATDSSDEIDGRFQKWAAEKKVWLQTLRLFL